ncbi:ABC transporter permease [candidate division KSB1 bacterium]
MKNINVHPPAWGQKFLKTILPESEKKYIIAGIEEEYSYKMSESGLVLTRLWYLKEILLILPFLMFDNISWRSVMLKNYVKTALRNIKRHKLYSFINIAGLAIGIASSILILLFVRDELSYDRYFEKADQIYRVVVDAMSGNTKIAQTYTPAILPGTLKEDFPEVLEATTCAKWSNYNMPVRYKDKNFSEMRVFQADSSFFKIFSFEFVQGDDKTPLSQPLTVVLTESTVEKYFGDENPIGKILNINNLDYKVTAIVKDVKPNSHFHFDFVISLTGTDGLKSTQWFQNNYRTYIVLQKGYDHKELDKKFVDFVTRHLYEGRGFSNENYWKYYLQPLTDIHLNSDLSGEFEPNGNKAYVYLFSVISVIILILACVNFMNLTTANSACRAKEIGIRKVAGSYRSQLMNQFIFETIIMCVISTVLAVFIIEMILPAYNNFLGKQLYIPYGNPIVIFGFLGLIIFVGFISGSYPAFFMSSFKPVTVIKSGSSSRSGSAVLRNGLVIFQFFVSIILIIGTIVVYRQLNFISNNRLGFDKERVVIVESPRYLGNSIDVFKEKLLQNSSISNVALSHTIPGRHHNNWGAEAGENTGFTLNICVVDEDFIETMNMEMEVGRAFSKHFLSDSNAIILNESAVKVLEWDEPLGKFIKIFGSIQHNVIGVVKDYHYESMRQKVRPMALLNLKGGLSSPRYVSIRINGENIPETLAYIENTWNSIAPGSPFDFFFLDQDYNKLYQNEKQTGDVFTIFSVLAVIIGSLGLFGLASYMAEQRKKEIGIRKAIGATAVNILFLLIRDFIKWPLFAVIFAWPFAWYFMNLWLKDFAYRIKLGYGIFIISLLISAFIMLITISYHTIKTAAARPADILKYE